ncbi:hypothetical protein Cgig2_008752 [Carnegiea gigantea]|uniref:Uncharacterized protein n=1 Tax=Carnegiea gigantea TaxID=171969 RepID=A0A9Q1JGJ3_9CARY|nr:hypothetical protein Cgig2_008752 [Carnegiea gigantea]
MTDTITRQVSEQVKRAVKAANLARPLPHFDYVPTHRGEPSHRPKWVPLPCYTEREREVSPSNRSDQPYTEKLGRRAAARPSGRPTRGATAKSTTASTPYEPAQPQPQDEECSTEVVATIVGGYAGGMTRSAWKAQLRSAQQVLTTTQGARTTVPTMVFGGKEAPRFASPHNDPLVIEMKIASAIEVNLTGMIRLSVRFGDKLKSKNLEGDFLIVDMPTACNVILGRPILHKGLHQALRRDSARDTPLHNLVHDHCVEDRLHHLGDVRVLSVLCSRTKVETRTEDEVILRDGPRALGREGSPPSASKSPLGMAEGHTSSPPGEDIWVSLSLSSVDNSHASMISHLSFRKFNIRLSSVSLLMSLNFVA